MNEPSPKPAATQGALVAGVTDRLLALAADAFAADAVDLAIEIARLAVETAPSRRSLSLLATYVAASGDAEEVIRIYRRMLDELGFAMDAPIALALGLAEAERGDFREALNYFWRVVALGEDNEELWFYIGSCYAMLRQFAAANHVFARDIRLPLQDRRVTSTALLRLPSRRDDIRRVEEAELPFRRDFVLDRDIAFVDERVADAEFVHLICCDSSYFRLFARAVARSMAERASVRAALHFHLVNAQPADLELFAALRASFDLPFVLSAERVDFAAMTQDEIKTYLTCVRFLLLPDLLARYAKPILVTDADQTILRPLGEFIAQARAHDVGLLLFPRAHYNILALISASVCVANATAQASAYFAAVRDYILERMASPGAIAWHLDQAALAAAYLASDDVDFWLMPPKTMISKVLKASSSTEEPALFWSATYSIATNARKLDSDEYQSLTA